MEISKIYIYVSYGRWLPAHLSQAIRPAEVMNGSIILSWFSSISVVSLNNDDFHEPLFLFFFFFQA